MRWQELDYFVLVILTVSCQSLEQKRPKYLGLGSLYFPSKIKVPFKQCDCGRSNEIPNIPFDLRIINGTEVCYHKYPWLTLILHKNEFICGGSIISDYYILTAAHCMSDNFLKDDLKVLLGEHNRCEASSDTVQLSISDIIRHAQFNPQTFRSDIMLLRVNMRITFNQFIRPICLPEFDYYQRTVFTKYQGRIGTISGWGSTIANNESSISCTPLQVHVPILKRDDCPNFADTLFCAGYLNGEADSCQGDSGGPLQLINRYNRYEIIGIISSGLGCAQVGRPGLYTDVLQNLNWIYKRISDSSCWNYPYSFYNL